MLRTRSTQKQSSYHVLQSKSQDPEDLNPLISDLSSATNYDIEWVDINMKVGHRTILDKCCGKVKTGEVCGILGPSGAGKTSLLNVLAGRSVTRGNTEVQGTIAIEQERIDPSKYRNHIAYVMQEDAHLKTVTPREAIEFSALLRLPNTISVEELKLKVTRMIYDLKLEHVADCMIGGGLMKGLSGGEKKRVSIGVEVITNPHILFLDEPTSGLDSYNAYTMMELLLNIAKKDRCTILATIHQPSSEIFELFDSIIVLKEGHVLYHGKTTDMVAYFSRFNYICPSSYNPADYVMFISQKDSLDTFQKTGILTENERNQQILYDSIMKYSMKSITSVNTTTTTVLNTTFFQQLYHLFGREVNKVMRDKGALIAKFGVTLFLNLLYGLIFLHIGTKGDNDYDYMNAHFGVIMMLSISSMFGSAQPIMLSLPIERPMFLREYSTGTYTAIAYFLSKTMVELPMTFITSLLQVSIIYHLCSFHGQFISMVFAVFMLSSASCSIALVLGSLVDDVKTASEIQPLIFTPQLLFAGFFIRTEFIPPFLRWSEYLCSLKYAISLILLNEFHNTNENCQGKEASKACNLILTRNGISEDKSNVYISVLLSLFLGFRILAAIVLVHRAKRF